MISEAKYAFQIAEEKFTLTCSVSEEECYQEIDSEAKVCAWNLEDRRKSAKLLSLMFYFEKIY